ncbi:MAG: phosphatidate cytidylyltransferase [Proteobacteria bacterium]|nr:phosphatidate cytidylyltransferase [Pseudomonadota bacterium]
MFDIPISSFIVMSVVIAILVFATFAAQFINSIWSNKDFTELNERIASWWWIIGLLFVALWAGRTASIVFFGFLSFLALKEFLSVVPTRSVDRNVVFWSYLAIPVQYLWIYQAWYGMFLIFIPVFVFLYMPIRMVIRGETSGFIKSAATIQWATMLTVFCLSHIAYLLNLPNDAENGGSIGLVLYLLLLTQFNDVCQFLWGKSFGKRKIIPKVSPNKTWEGFIGGMMTVVLSAALLAPFLTPLTFFEGLAAGVIISVAGFFGDVVISSIKRDLGIKDSGTLLPGHGGILDRMDSLIYTAPVFFHFLYYLKY